MYGGGRRSGGGVATGCRTTARATAATTTAPLQPPSRRLAQPAAGGNGQSPAAGAVLTVRRQAKDALAELERRRASTPVGGISRAARGSSNSREPAAAGEGQAKAALGASTSSLGSVCTTASVALAPAAGLLAAAAAAAPITTSGPAAAPPPPPILYAQLSSASSNLSLDELALAAHEYDEEDPMSPQSVFPRVRQKLREEAAANAGGGVLAGAGVVDADQSGDHLSLSLPSPVAVAAAAAATKKRCGRQLPEIPQTVRCRTPPLVVLSASADDASRLYGSFDDEGCSVHELSGGGSTTGNSTSNCGTPRGQAGAAALPVFHRTAPAAVSASAGANNNLASSSASLVTSIGAASSMGSVTVGAASASAASSSQAGTTGAGTTGVSVITPLPRSAIQKSSLYELRAAFQELSRALAEMEVAATKRARVRSEAYIIKFEHEYADLARVKDRAMKRLEALLRAGPGGTPAFAPDSPHAQVLGGVLRVVLDIDDELLLLMGTEHGTWEELKRVRGEIQKHLLLLGRELGGEAVESPYDPLCPVPMVRSLSSPTGAGPGGFAAACCSSGGGYGGSGSVFSFAPAAVVASVSRSSTSASKRKAAVAGAGTGRAGRDRSGSPSEEDVFKLRPLEASLSSLGSSGPLPGGSSSGGSSGKEGLAAVSVPTNGAPQPTQQSAQPRRPAPLQHPGVGQPSAQQRVDGRDPESPGTMTTASLSSSASSAFSQLSECASDEEQSVGGGGGTGNGNSGSGASAASSKALSASASGGGAASYRLPVPMNKSVSSDALSDLLNPLPAALTAKVREKASFLHHRTLGNNKPLYEAALGGGSAGARPRYHTTVGAAVPGTAGRVGAAVNGGAGVAPRVARPVVVMEAAAKS